MCLNAIIYKTVSICAFYVGGCIKIKFFGTPSLFMLPENLIKQSRLFFGDNPEISDSRDAKYDKNAKSGRIGAIFPRFWPVVLFLNTFS